MQGSAVQSMETDDSPTNESAESAVAALEAATHNMQQLRNNELRQLLHHGKMDGGDKGSGTEAGPKPRHKRPADHSLVQRAAKKRAGLDSGSGSGDNGGPGIVEGEGVSAAGAGTSGGAVSTAMNSGAHATQQRRMLRQKKI